MNLTLEISAFDTKGNGYSESNPHVERLYVDNDYPKASYEPPKDINDEEIKDGVYLSVKNNIHDLTFILDDVVGDKLDKRSLLLYKSSGEKYPVSFEQFYKNETKRFVVRLCSQKDCSGQGVTINQGMVTGSQSLAQKITWAMSYLMLIAVRQGSASTSILKLQLLMMRILLNDWVATVFGHRSLIGRTQSGK